MFRFVKPLLLLLAQAADSELRAMIEYLKAENRILRDKLPKRIPITKTERRLLAEFAKPLGKKITELVTIVSPKTLLRWINQDSKPKPETSTEKKPERPKTVADTRELIIRFASENGWGYDRILGELKKLGINVSKSTVRNILKENGFDIGPTTRQISCHSRQRIIQSQSKNCLGMSSARNGLVANSATTTAKRRKYCCKMSKIAQPFDCGIGEGPLWESYSVDCHSGDLSSTAEILCQTPEISSIPRRIEYLHGTVADAEEALLEIDQRIPTPLTRTMPRPRRRIKRHSSLQIKSRS